MIDDLMHDDVLGFGYQCHRRGPLGVIQRVGDFAQAVEADFKTLMILPQHDRPCRRHDAASELVFRTERPQSVEDDGDVDGFLRQGAGDGRQPSEGGQPHRRTGHGHRRR